MIKSDFSEEELITIRKALSAYIAHLEPSASYIKQIDDWREELNKIQFKIGHILMNSRRMM
jgi:hypothetical protein